MVKWIPLVLLAINFGYSQNKIDKAKDDLNQPSNTTISPSNSNQTGGRTRGRTHQSDPSLLEFFITDIAFGLMKYGLIGSYATEDHLHYGATPYPLQKHGKGSYSSDSDYPLWRTHFQNRFLYSNNTLIGNEIQGSIHPSKYFYASVSYAAFWEFNRIEDRTNHLNLFYFHLHYDRIRLEQFQLGWKIGMSYIGTGVNKAGFSYGLQAQYFFQKNYSFAGNINWSQINQQPVNQLDVQIKRHWNNYHLHLGYQHYRIGSPQFRFIGLGGGIYL